MSSWLCVKGLTILCVFLGALHNSTLTFLNVRSSVCKHTHTRELERRAAEFRPSRDLKQPWDPANGLRELENTRTIHIRVFLPLPYKALRSDPCPAFTAVTRVQIPPGMP